MTLKTIRYCCWCLLKLRAFALCTYSPNESISSFDRTMLSPAGCRTVNFRRYGSTVYCLEVHEGRTLHTWVLVLGGCILSRCGLIGDNSIFSSRFRLVRRLLVSFGIKVAFIADARPSSSTLLNFMIDLSIFISLSSTVYEGIHIGDLGATFSFGVSRPITLNFCPVKERSSRRRNVLEERI